MRAIFLCEKPRNIQNVYGELLHLIPGIEAKVYSRADLVSEPRNFADVRFLFSTWGMPDLTEAEIEACLPSLECVFYGAGTVQKFARPFLTRGIKVFSAWAANAVPVAEMTVAQIVLANNGYFLTNRLYHAEGNAAAKQAIFFKIFIIFSLYSTFIQLTPRERLPNSLL